MMTAREYEKAQKKLEEKLRVTSQQLTNLAVENTNLNNALRAKEKLIEDLNRHKSRVDIEFIALMAILDSTEKENAFLRYEFHMLEKELEIRSEEMEYNRRSAEESHKQLLESEENHKVRTRMSKTSSPYAKKAARSYCFGEYEE